MPEPQEQLDASIKQLEKLKADLETLLGMGKQKFGKMLGSQKSAAAEVGLFENNVLYIKCATPEIAKQLMHQLK